MAVTRYTDEAALRQFLGATLVDALASLGGSVSSEVLGRAIDDACREIDAALGQVYVVPFAAYSTGNTPDLVHLLANILSTYYLLLKRHPAAEETTQMRERADALISALQDGSYEIPGAAKVAAAKGARASRLAAGSPAFAGQTDAGRDRMADW